MDQVTAYPLCWPAGWPRCQQPVYSKFQTSLARARTGVLAELDRLGASGPVISSNAFLLANGQIAARQPKIEDTGVAVYFWLGGQRRCIPCDKWVKVEENLRAIELTVNAIRGLERWGAQEIVAAALQGFQALPASTSGEAWWRVLEIAPTASEMEIEAAYRRLAKRHHPDAGGSDEAFVRVRRAYTEAINRRKSA